MDDMISRQAAIDAVEKESQVDGAYGYMDTKSIVDLLNNLPAAQPERKKGKWKGYNADNPKWQRTDGTPIFLVCSECNGNVLNNGSAHWNFCPNCGADMRGEQNATN